MTIAVSGKLSTLPIGSIQSFGGVVAPEGWLMCDGSSVLRTTYPKLFAVIATAYGTADATHFNLPDLRGKFLRGVAHGQATDPDRATRTAQATGGNTGDNVGSVQTDAMQGHKHTGSQNILTEGGGAADGGGSNTFSYDSLVSIQNGYDADGTNGTPRTTSESRPKNVNVEYIIKYDHVANNYIAESKSLCKAWVVFDGTTASPCTILDSYNVSSVTKIGNGQYTVNFTTPFSSANYSTVASGKYTGAPISIEVGNTITASSVSILTLEHIISGDGRSPANNALVSVQSFGS